VKSFVVTIVTNTDLKAAFCIFGNSVSNCFVVSISETRFNVMVTVVSNKTEG
jgi:hypothetical protein